MRTHRVRGPVALVVLAALAVVPGLLASGSSTLTAPASAQDPPLSATLTIANASSGFKPKTVTIDHGGSLTVVNNDSYSHTVTSVAVDASGDPRFDVLIQAHRTRTVPVESLGGGRYSFYCKLHPSMRGTLVVNGPPDGSVGDHPPFEQPLAIPPRLTGSHLRVVLRKADVRVLPHGPRTPMWTFNGHFPGPTIVEPTGRDTHVTFVNRLPRSAGSVTIHQHGGHHRSADDGQPTRHLIRHGHERTYDYPLVNDGTPVPAALSFYHDHRMDRTARNNWRGLQGMFLVTDPRERRLGLPTGRYDVPLMVGDRSFTKTNHLTDPFSSMGGMTMRRSGTAPNDATVGTKVLVNGRFAPYLRVQPGQYRLRLLNASLFSSYDFALSDGSSFVQVGTGSGLLPHPVTRSDILLGPAQRADVVVDFRESAGKNPMLTSIPRRDGSKTGIGTRTAALMQFRVRGTTNQHARVPGTLTRIPSLHLPARVSKTWNFGLSRDAHGRYWSINGKRFDPRRVDARVPLGSTQMWRLHNSSQITHFVHLHEELWRTVSRDGATPPPWERGYEDTWRLDPGETVLVAAKFTDYTGDFMIHCHMLDHEDDGMMATFRVVKPR